MYNAINLSRRTMHIATARFCAIRPLSGKSWLIRGSWNGWSCTHSDWHSFIMGTCVKAPSVSTAFLGLGTLTTYHISFYVMYQTPELLWLPDWYCEELLFWPGSNTLWLDYQAAALDAVLIKLFFVHSYISLVAGCRPICDVASAVAMVTK